MQKSETAADEVEPPKPKKSPSKLSSILDVPAVELARQLTLIEFDLFAAIRPTEIRCARRPGHTHTHTTNTHNSHTTRTTHTYKSSRGMH